METRFRLHAWAGLTLALGLLHGCGGGDGLMATSAGAALAGASPEARPAHVFKGVVDEPESGGQIMPAAVSPAVSANITPALMRAAYGLDAVHTPGNDASYGAGQTIAIIDAFHNPAILRDLRRFNTRYGLPPCEAGCFSVVYTRNGVPISTHPKINAGWAMESSLDVEWAHAVAPLAKIILVETASASMDDLLGAARYAVTGLGATVVSMSFGGSEWAGQLAATSTYFGLPNATFVAASGDDGHGVSYPAASPGVLAVGGSTLKLGTGGTYLSETAWSGSGGGISAYETAQPAYWPSVTPLNLVRAFRVGRPVPDVAWNADPATGFYVFSETGMATTKPGIVGGTSAGAPQWAGLLAIANALRQQAGKPAFTSARTTSGTGPAIHTALAQLSAQSGGALTYTALYNDITSGTNGGCGVRCTAAAGWDLTTGLGSPNAATLVPALVAY